LYFLPNPVRIYRKLHRTESALPKVTNAGYTDNGKAVALVL